MTKRNLEAMRKRLAEQYELYSAMKAMTNSENSKKYFTEELERIQLRIYEVDDWIEKELYIKEPSLTRKSFR